MDMEDGNVRLVKPDIKNLDALIDLEPFESQREFVADNCYSLSDPWKRKRCPKGGTKYLRY